MEAVKRKDKSGREIGEGQDQVKQWERTMPAPFVTMFTCLESPNINTSQGAKF